MGTTPYCQNVLYLLSLSRPGSTARIKIMGLIIFQIELDALILDSDCLIPGSETLQDLFRPPVSDTTFWHFNYSYQTSVFIYEVTLSQNSTTNESEINLRIRKYGHTK